MRDLMIVNLQLFAEGGGEKTEKATPKKKREARKKGQVLQSRELTSALVLTFIFLIIKITGKYIYAQLIIFYNNVFSNYMKIENFFNITNIKIFFIDSILVFIKMILPVMAVAIIAGTIISYAQVGSMFSTEALMFKADRINPLKGFKRIFSSKSVIELVKSILKLVIISWMAWSFLNKETLNVITTMGMEINTLSVYIFDVIIKMAFRFCIVLILISIVDYLYQWWEYEKNLKMTKQEIKEEYKQTEGNPEIKSKIKQKQRQLAMNRMLHEVPGADVVITNPTHYAVALKYDELVNDAPVLLGKGIDYMALRIKEIAQSSNVEIVENKYLARTLYNEVDIGEAIPAELYKAVAEILAFVYNLRGKAAKA